MIMTGLEMLKAEMLNRGLTSQQIGSKVLPVVLSILSENDEYLKLNDIQEDIRKKKEELSDIEEKLKCIKRDLDWTLNVKLRDANNRLKEVNCEIESKEKEVIDYIENFNKSLENCETAEARDRLRTAQFYRNSIILDTKYDQTAYNIGLAQIITGGKFDGLETLKEINPKLFEKKPVRRIV